MKEFKTIQERNKYFDNILDLYKSGELDKATKAIQKLKQKQERDFLYYVYNVLVSPATFSLILDAIY